MGIKERLTEQGKKITSSGAFVRLVGNDKVMRVATGVMDARSRFKAAGERLGEADVTGRPAAKATGNANGHASNGAAPVSAAPAATAPAKGATGGGAVVEVTAAEKSLAKDMAARTSLSRIGGRDVFEKCQKFM